MFERLSLLNICKALTLVFILTLFDTSSLFHSLIRASTEKESLTSGNTTLDSRLVIQPPNASTQNITRHKNDQNRSSIINKHNVIEAGKQITLNIVRNIKKKIDLVQNYTKNVILKIIDQILNLLIPKRKQKIFQNNLLNSDINDNNNISFPISWGNIAVSDKEKINLKILHKKREKINDNKYDKNEYKNDKKYSNLSPWIYNATTTDFLRFLRFKNGHVEEAWKAIIGE